MSLYKLSQKTRFDEKVREIRRPWSSSSKQELLPNILPLHSPTYIKEELRRYIPGQKEEIGPLEFKELVFPQITEEKIKLKPLPEESIKGIEYDIKKNKEYAENMSYTNYHKEQIERLEKILSDNKNLSSSLVSNVIKKYQELQQISLIFYKKYKEANMLASTTPEINFSVSYIDFLKQLPDYISNFVSVRIGILFGHTREQRHFRRSKSARSIIHNIRSINLFNINAQNIHNNYNLIIHMINDMSNIIDEYDRKKKLLSYLQKNISKSINSFLSEANNVEFLNWLEENYPNLKSELLSEVVSKIQQDRELDFYALEKMKTYISIYKNLNKLPENVRENITAITLDKLQNELKVQIHTILSQKSKSLLDVIDKIIPDDMYNQYQEQIDRGYYLEDKVNIVNNIDFSYIFRFIKNTLNVDLNSIFLFVEKSILKNSKEKDILSINPLLNNCKLYFLIRFKKSLRFSIRNLIIGDVQKYINNIYNSSLYIKEVSKLTTQDFEKIALNIIRESIIDSVPNLTRKSFNNLPNLTGISPILENSEKPAISVSALMNFLSKHPFVPKDFAFNLSKHILKVGDIQSMAFIGSLKNESCNLSLQILIKLLQKSNKFFINNFIALFTTKIESIRQNVNIVLTSFENRDLITKYIIDIVINSIRNVDTIDSDLNALQDMIKFIHNSAGGISPEQTLKIIVNPNFFQFRKTKVIEKMIKAYLLILSKGGTVNIAKEFGPAIKELQKRKYLGRDFMDNIKYVINYFESNTLLNPSSDDFQKMFSATSKIETDFTTIETLDGLKDLLQDYQPKNKKLFKLDLDITPDLRFRVLKDKDPRMLRVGIETNCCQRIGGVGESAAKDSFINPLAGVLILEWKHENEWKLLTQSYFHYVPQDNGYILDNVESNQYNINNSNYDIDEIYALYASKINTKITPKYFLAGKGYSKIDPDQFATHKMDDDPRSFNPKALSGRSSHYSDFNERNSINLLKSKYDIKYLNEKYTSPTKAEANFNLQILRKFALNLQLIPIS